MKKLKLLIEKEKLKFTIKDYLENTLDLSPNFYYWVKLLSKFISAQLVIQALMAVSGIIIIRTLSKEEYAYFTIANSLQSAMNILSNSGLSSGLIVIGGRIWQDPYEMGKLTNTILKLRFVLGLLIVPIVTVILFWLLINAGSDFLYTILIVVAILIELIFYFYLSLFQSHLQLHSLFDKIQQQGLILGFIRLSLLFIGYRTVLNAMIATYISTIVSGLNFWFLKRSTFNLFNSQAPISIDYEEELITLLKYHLPTAIFYTFQGQITIWLMTIFGSINNIAEIGALSRLGLIFAVVSPLISTIIAPEFAKSNSISLLRKKYFTILVFFIISSLLLLFITYLFPGIFLWVLGSNYSELSWEVFLIVLSQSITFIGSIIYTLNYSKGWLKYLWFNIPITLLFQALVLFFLNLSQTKGVILFGILSQLPGIMINCYLNYSGLFRNCKNIT